jgi:hypothetical protein
MRVSLCGVNRSTVYDGRSNVFTMFFNDTYIPVHTFPTLCTIILVTTTQNKSGVLKVL